MSEIFWFNKVISREDELERSSPGGTTFLDAMAPYTNSKTAIKRL